MPDLRCAASSGSIAWRRPILPLCRKRRTLFDPAYSPAVAVVVPAYNEEKVIVQTIVSLLACDQPDRFEIIVVDDGSKDATYGLARDTFAGEPRVRVYTQPNGGKPAALNFGLAQTQAEIVVALDADTVFTRDTITNLVRHFATPGSAPWRATPRWATAPTC